MNFQTIFYDKATGEILHIEQNRYIRNKFDKLKYTPGRTHDEINFMYFQSAWPIDIKTHKVNFVSATQPPIITDADNQPLFWTDRRLQFIEATEKYQTIIVDLADSMGDQLLRLACVIEAQKQNPGHKFFYKCEPQYKEVLALCPDITPFVDYKTHGLDPKQCGTIKMNGGHLYDPRGKGFGKASMYGSFLNLTYVPYHTRLTVPLDFSANFEDFNKSIGLRNDGHNIVFQLRSKNWEGKSWDVQAARELARLAHTVYDCNIYWLGAPQDVQKDFPEFINLCGKTSWMETINILTQASHIFCIDSAIMHLSRALDIPYYCLWGETHPQHIMGEDPRPEDFCATFEIGKTDIKAITPLQVFNRAFPQNAITPSLVYDPAKNTSQHGDQKIIYDYFAGHPAKYRTLVDVGAFGHDMSNTFALLELGWQGLLIEANPERVEVIKKEFAGMNVKIINIGISDRKGKAELHLHSELGHDSLLHDWYPQDLTGKTIEIDVLPLASVLRKNKIPHDFDLLSNRYGRHGRAHY